MTRGAAPRRLRRLRLWIGVVEEAVRASLFVAPLLSAIAALVTAELMLALDRRVGPLSSDVPFASRWTVDSARAMLTTVASATITVAGIAFSVSLLTIQLAAAEYSPRVIRGLFRDPFNRRVLGIVVGTFTYPRSTDSSGVR